MEDGVSCGADFSGEDLEDFQRHERVILHEGVEAFPSDEAESRSRLGACGEGVGLVADEGWEAEQGAGDGADGDDGVSDIGSHGEGDFAFVEDVEAFRGIALEEKDSVVVAQDRDRALLQRLNEFRISDERGCVQLQLWFSD